MLEQKLLTNLSVFCDKLADGFLLLVVVGLLGVIVMLFVCPPTK